MNKKIDILLPCLNEKSTIGECIKRINKVMKKEKYNYNIVVCDNNSTDDSRKIAKKEKTKIIIEKEKGYGSTILNGIKKSKADFIVMLDADLSYNEKDIPKMIKCLDKCDLVIGNRFKGTIEKNAMTFSHRYGSKLLTEYGNLLFRTISHDYHCGLRAFKREKIINCNLSSRGFEFASEMIIKAKLNKLVMKEIPTDLFVDGRNSPSHLNTFKDGFRHLHLINKVKFQNSIFFRYATTFIFVFGVLFLFSLFSAMIPHKYIEKNTLKSVDELNIMFSNKYLNENEYTKFEQFGDVRNFAMIYQEDSNHPFKSVIEKNYLEKCDVLLECPMTLKNNYGNTIDYSRYWHGQTSILKCLTVFISINTITIISFLLLLTLFFLTIYKLWKKDKLYSIAFFLAGLSVNILFVSKSFQFFPVFVIMLIGTNIIINSMNKNNNNIDLLFLILGMVTAYFDFLTVETITLTLPLITYIYFKIKNKEKNDFKEILKYILLWGMGYSLLFLIKWVVVLLHYGFSYINVLLNNINNRIDYNGSNNNILLGVVKNFTPVLPFAIIKNGFLIEIILLIILFIYELFVNKKYNYIMIIILIPIIRYLIISSHSYTLYYFTYRALYPVVMVEILITFDIIKNIVGSDSCE